jgi:hypothetical protein
MPRQALANSIFFKNMDALSRGDPDKRVSYSLPVSKNLSICHNGLTFVGCEYDGRCITASGRRPFFSSQQIHMSKDEQPTPEAFAALRARFQDQSRKAQAYYSVMHEAKGISGTDDAASAWMNAPLPAFGGKTPAEVVNDGREDDVLAYIRKLKSGSPG